MRTTAHLAWSATVIIYLINIELSHAHADHKTSSTELADHATINHTP